MKTLWVSIGICLASVCIVCESSELLAVVTLYRHGDRGPILLYNNDPFKSQQSAIWPNGLEQLTNAGKIRQFKMGQYFARRYKNFLPEKYSSEFLQVMSSNIDRCLMSASAHLAGLFPPKKEQIWNEQLTWQPIPIHTRPLPEDFLIALQRPCRKYTRLYEEFKNSRWYKRFLGKQTRMFEYLSQKTGDNITSTISAFLVHDTLLVEQQAGLSLPRWTRGIFPKYTLPVCIAEFTFQAHRTDLARLKGGPLVDYIATFFENVLSNPEKSQKYLMLSGHDLTVVVLLSALKLYDRTLPEYASTVILELRREGDINFVNILFKNSTDLYDLQLKDCSFNCPFNQFQNIIKPVRSEISEWQEECNEIDK